MKGLIILGSPRKGGNTEIILNTIREGMIAKSCDVETIRLNELNLLPCQSCGGCDKTGKCVLKDDMREVYSKIDKSDVVIIGSPIYFYGVTAQAKAFIDRTQAMWARKYRLKQSPPHKNGNRCGYLVCIAATKGKKIFDGAIMTVQYGFDAMDIEYCGEFLVRGIDSKGAINSKQEDLIRAFEFGKDICMR